MIVFEDIESTAKMQVELSNIFGPLKDHPVKMVERLDQDTMPGVITIRTSPDAAICEIDGKTLITWQPWHFDHTYNNELNRAGVLRAETIAPEGGMTAFADGIQIYNDMDPAIRAKAEGLNVLYNLDLRYDRQRFGLPKGFKLVKPHDDMSLSIQNEDGRCSVHPAIWTRPQGEKIFHMCPYGCRGIEGDRSDAAFEKLAEIWNEAERVMKVYYHEWQQGDMVIWDNTRVLHEATGSNPDEEREIHRTTIKGGDYHLGRWEAQPEETAA